MSGVELILAFLAGVAMGIALDRLHRRLERLEVEARLARVRDQQLVGCSPSALVIVCLVDVRVKTWRAEPLSALSLREAEPLAVRAEARAASIEGQERLPALPAEGGAALALRHPTQALEQLEVDGREQRAPPAALVDDEGAWEEVGHALALA
jgi:hypothetical protein